MNPPHFLQTLRAQNCAFTVAPATSAAEVLKMAHRRSLPQNFCPRNHKLRCRQGTTRASLPQGVPPDPEFPRSSAETESLEAERLSSEFMRFVTEHAEEWPLPRPFPTALMPPTAVVKALMDALMRNDWPDAGNGIQAAFRFSLPRNANDMIVGDPMGGPARTWEASEKYLSMEEFAQMLQQSLYSPIICCDSWELCSPLTFHRRGDEHALQAVKVKYTRQAEDGAAKSQECTYTFILQKVVKGPLKGCWMVLGVRHGDYANV